MDQHLPKLHDLNVCVLRLPELPLGQSRGGFLPICFSFQLQEALAKVVPLRLRPEKCAQSVQQGQRGNTRNSLVANNIGGYFA